MNPTLCPSIPSSSLQIQLTASPHRKIPWRLSSPQKRRQRKRLRLVDNVISTIDNALKKQNMGSTTKLERWKEEMPTEAEMRPKDKYTMFDRKEKRYRKGIHSRSTLLLGVVLQGLRTRRLIRDVDRAAEVDEGQSEDKSSRLLMRIRLQGEVGVCGVCEGSN